MHVLEQLATAALEEFNGVADNCIVNVKGAVVLLVNVNDGFVAVGLDIVLVPPDGFTTDQA